jgi:hypothetical protein
MMNARVNSDLLELLFAETSDYPLQIQPIPESERISLELGCSLIHRESGLHIPGQFTSEDATLIQAVTQDWDWRIEKNNKPACAAQLLQFLQAICAPPADNKGGAI